MASTTKIMNKPHQEQQQPQAVLKCPRCDSSNTKFCYYNNYSLSQPRHFCKACKRYWTRGGTLRNVPVGGGCRKNKRLKTSSSIVNVASSLAPSSHPRPQNGINLSSSVSSHITPMFYDSNLQFSRLESVSGLNLPPQLDATAAAVGLGFSSGVMSHIADLRDGFDSVKQIQEMVTSNNHFHPTISFQRNMQVLGNSEDNLIATKEVQMDQSINRSSCQNQTEQMDLSFSDPNSHYWNTTTTTTIATGNNWLDQMNTGSSVTSLF